MNRLEEPPSGRTGAQRRLDGTRRLAREDVDDGVLDERREDEYEADDHPDVDGLDVGHARQRGAGSAAHRRSRQHRQQANGDARRRRVDVDPEGDPGENDDQHARNVDLYEEVTDVTLEDEPDLEARKRTWK